MKTEPAEPLLSEPPDFSLILGGPLFQLLRRAHLCGDVAELVISVDKTYVPAVLVAGNKDPRELGVRVFHAYIDPR